MSAETEGALGAVAIRRAAAILYLTLTGGALLWTRIRTGDPIPPSVVGGDPAMSLILGVGLGVGVVVATGVAMKGSRRMREFAFELRQLLGPLDLWTCVVLAIFSGVAEEIFFRGAMQPVWGYPLTSVFFGCLHVGPGRRYLVWTVFAIVVGFLLGGIVELTGNLLGPVVAHVGINAVNLARISRLPGSR